MDMTIGSAMEVSSGSIGFSFINVSFMWYFLLYNSLGLLYPG